MIGEGRAGLLLAQMQEAGGGLGVSLGELKAIGLLAEELKASSSVVLLGQRQVDLRSFATAVQLFTVLTVQEED